MVRRSNLGAQGSGLWVAMQGTLRIETLPGRAHAIRRIGKIDRPAKELQGLWMQTGMAGVLETGEPRPSPSSAAQFRL
jgi:hypothetical protein